MSNVYCNCNAERSAHHWQAGAGPLQLYHDASLLNRLDHVVLTSCSGNLIQASEK